MFGFLTLLMILLILFTMHLVGILISLPTIQIFKKIRIMGYDLHYRSSGQGSRKVILIHGMFSNLHCWDKLLAFATPDTEFIALDLPQMAESMTPNKITPAENIEDIVYEFAKALNLERPILVGCSLGGLVAYLSALKYDEYFRQCIIVASPFDSKLLLLPIYKLSFLAPLLNLFVNPIIACLSYLRIAKSEFSFKHVLIILSKFRRSRHYQSSMEYTYLIPRAEKAIAISTKVERYHFIWGTRDQLIKKSRFKNFLDQNRTLEYDEMPDATHHPMESHPELFSKTLNDILNKTLK